MGLQAFKEEIAAHYTGLTLEVTRDRDPSYMAEQQGIAWRSLYSAIVCLQDKQDKKDLENFVACLKVRQADGPGLYHRKAGDWAVMNAHDDLVYAAVASMLLEPTRAVAWAIYDYGQRHNWFYNNMKPNVPDPETCLARHYWFIPLLKVCAGARTEWYENAMLSAFIVASAIKTDGSGTIMSWMATIPAFKTGSPICAVACWFWGLRLRKRYEGGMPEACRLYFQKQGEPVHPFGYPEAWWNIPKEYSI